MAPIKESFKAYHRLTSKSLLVLQAAVIIVLYRHPNPLSPNFEVFLPSPSGPATLLVLFRRGSTKVLGSLAGQIIVIFSDGITALLPVLICNFALCDNPLKRSLIVCFKCPTNLLLKFSLVIITLSRTLLYMCIVAICFK